MLYILQSWDYGSLEYQGVFQGPPGLDLYKLRQAFYASFEIKPPKYPVYKGPNVELAESRMFDDKFHSGAISVSDGNGKSVEPDTATPEYREWEKAYEKIRKDWQKKSDQKVKDIRKKYPGRSQSEMFLSYLKQEYKLKKVEAESVDL